MEKKTKKTSNYISIKESRAIIKYNIKQMKYYENLKRQKRDESEYITSMKDPNNIIEIDNLKTCFFTDNGTVMSVNGVSFSIPKNKIVGVVGESGCGKSVTSLSIMQLVQSPQGQIVDGQIKFNYEELGYYEDGTKKLLKDLTEDEQARIREQLDKHVLEGDLRREVSLNIKTKMEIGSYQGIRHKKGLPVRGQSTRSNARTRKGKGKTVANKKK